MNCYLKYKYIQVYSGYGEFSSNDIGRADFGPLVIEVVRGFSTNY